MHIFLCFDEKLIQQAGALVASLARHHKKDELILHVLTEGDFLNKEKRLLSYCRQKFETRYYPLFDEVKVLEKLPVSGHITKTAYLRLLLPEVISNEIHSGIYLDLDIIVINSLKSMIQFEYKHPIGAVSDEMAQEHGKAIGLDYYFNSGVLWINLFKIRKLNLISEIEELTKWFKPKWHDQDLLNMVFKDNVDKLPSKFNAQINFNIKTKANAIIIHFSGRAKPWKNDVVYPLAWQYVFFLLKTPYKVSAIRQIVLKTPFYAIDIIKRAKNRLV